MLTEAEIRQAKTYASGDWALLSYDALTQVSVWIRREGTKIRFRETQPVDTLIDVNKERKNDWQGWTRQKKKDGHIVASIPITVYNEMVKKCGHDGGQYDQAKFNKLLNDSDYSAWRTGGGKLKTDNRVEV